MIVSTLWTKQRQVIQLHKLLLNLMQWIQIWQQLTILGFKTIDTNTNKLISVPPSVLLPGVFASNDRVAAEWFAPAGLNRGGLTGAV